MAVKLSDEISATMWVNDHIRFDSESEIGTVADEILTAVADKLIDQVEEEHISETLTNVSDEQFLDEVETVLQENPAMAKLIDNISYKLSEGFTKKVKTLQSVTTGVVEELINTINNSISVEVDEADLSDVIQTHVDENGNTVSSIINTTETVITDGSSSPELRNYNDHDNANNPLVQELLGQYSYNPDLSKLSNAQLSTICKNTNLEFKTVHETLDVTALSTEIIQDMYPSNEAHQKTYLPVVEDIVNTFVLHNNADKFKLQVVDMLKFSTKYMNNECMSGTMLEAATKFINVYQIFEHIPDISGRYIPAVVEKIHNNISVMKNIYQACLLVLNQAKYSNKSVLVFDNGYVNALVFNEYTQHNGSEDMIKKYLRINHNKNEKDIMYASAIKESIPTLGITIETMLMKEDSVVSTYDSIKANLDMFVKTKIDDIVNTSIYNVVGGYVKSSDLSHTDKQLALQSLSYSIQKYIEDKDSNSLEGLVSDFIFKTYYTDTLEKSIYDTLAVESIKLFNKDPNLDTETRDILMLKTMATLTTKFIANNFVK